MAATKWESANGNIKKIIISSGAWALKPTENCDCCVKITNCSSSEIEIYTAMSSVTIGNSNNQFERLLDTCLQTMFPGEIAEITFKLSPNQCCCFRLELVSFESKGLIYEWNAERKFQLALEHKEKGIELYKKSSYVDASFRFGKGLKILCSIPLEVDDPPIEIDGIKVDGIEELKAVLYNNLAACYLKHCDYEIVLKLCSKVLQKDHKNVKALYKQSVARYETHDYEGSQKSLLALLKFDPENKVAADKLKAVNVKVAEDNARVNAMIKKMFEQ